MRILPRFTMVGLLAAINISIAAESGPTPLGHVTDGVYYQANGFQTTIVELNRGKFRFWFSSDVLLAYEKTEFPQSGSFMTNGGTITFLTTNVYRTSTGNWTTVHTNHWTFMRYKDQATLWRPEAVNYWNDKKGIDPYGVLFRTTKKPEQIWRR